MMKTSRMILITAALAMLSTACPKQETAMWEKTYWILTEVEGRKVESTPEGRKIYVHLPEGPNGRVEGFAGCNRFFGTCSLEQDHLRFEPLARTKMMCPQMETENAFLSALEKTDAYQILGRELRLMAEGKDVARFLPSEEQP